jgi:hypothetical protein
MNGLTTRRLFVAIFLLALFAMAVRETLDPDMWWHLRTGQVILSDGIPNQDIFSFTVPENEWITHEWLSEVVMWLGFRVVGLPGLMLFFAAIVAGAFWLVYLRCAGRPYLAVFVVLLAALATAPFWGVRPQMFNMLFTAAFVFLVEGYKNGQVSRRALWLLPILTLFWANLHSGYLLGIILLLTYVAGESLGNIFTLRQKGTVDWSPAGWLFLMTLIAFLVAIINPNGPELWIYPFFTLGSDAMQRYIQEWQSPNFHLAIFWPFALLLLLGILAMIAGRRRPTATDILLFCGTAAAGLLSSRHIPIFAIVSAPIISRHLLNALDGTRLNPWMSGQVKGGDSDRSIIINWILLLIMALVAAVWIAGKIQTNEQAIAARFPVAAVDHLEQIGLDQRHGYNSYNWGGYMIWRGLPVFVDGRADVYGDDFLFDYRRTFDLTDGWQLPLDEYNVDFVLIEQASPLANLLEASSDWEQAYGDNVASLYLRAAQ